MGKTILISSHILSELAELCNKVAIIERGQLVFSGPVEDILRRVRRAGIVQVKLREGNDRALSMLNDHPMIAKVAQIDGGLIECELKPEAEDYTFLPSFLIEKGFKILVVREEQVNLEDAFMKVTKGQVA
jgi:ABC-2 type transport system ATP-binding protein